MNNIKSIRSIRAIKEIVTTPEVNIGEGCDFIVIDKCSAIDAIIFAEEDAKKRYTKEIEERISREIVRDQCEGRGWEFVEKMQLKYGRRLEIFTRGILRDNYPSSTLEKDKATLDNQLIEMVFDNQLVAMAYYRRNTFNFTEVTCVEIGGREQPFNPCTEDNIGRMRV